MKIYKKKQFYLHNNNNNNNLINYLPKVIKIESLNKFLQMILDKLVLIDHKVITIILLIII